MGERERWRWPTAKEEEGGDQRKERASKLVGFCCVLFLPWGPLYIVGRVVHLTPLPRH
jgi:hypothetical protein